MKIINNRETYITTLVGVKFNCWNCNWQLELEKKDISIIQHSKFYTSKMELKQSISTKVVCINCCQINEVSEFLKTP